MELNDALIQDFVHTALRAYCLEVLKHDYEYVDEWVACAKQLFKEML